MYSRRDFGRLALAAFPAAAVAGRLRSCARLPGKAEFAVGRRAVRHLRAVPLWSRSLGPRRRTQCARQAGCQLHRADGRRRRALRGRAAGRAAGEEARASLPPLRQPEPATPACADGDPLRGGRAIRRVCDTGRRWPRSAVAGAAGGRSRPGRSAGKVARLGTDVEVRRRAQEVQRRRRTHLCVPHHADQRR